MLRQLMQDFSAPILVLLDGGYHIRACCLEWVDCVDPFIPLCAFRSVSLQHDIAETIIIAIHLWVSPHHPEL